MKKLLLVCVFAIAAMSTTGCVISDGDSSIEFFNDSDFILIDIAVAAEFDDSFGRNLIPDDLLPGESVIVILDCDIYDVRIEDEFNTVCDIVGVDVCFDDIGFVIDNGFLNNCF